MLERIVSFFERIAVALETIAGTITNAGRANQAVPPPAATSAPLTPTGLAHNEGGAKEHANLVQQAQMPAASNILTPAFGNAAATDFLAPAPPTTVAPPTREAVGNALIELATVSRDKAVEVLAAFGGAQKLSQVPESEYPTLLLNINKTRAGLA